MELSGGCLCIAFVLIVTGVSAAPRGVVDCGEQLMRSDQCLRDVLSLATNASLVPTTVQKLDDVFCSKTRKTLRCVYQYTKCLKPFPKTTLKIVMSVAKDSIKKVCGSDEGKKEFVYHMKCFTPEVVDYYVKQLDKLLTVLNFMAVNVTIEEILPWSCCLINRVKENARKVLDNHCLEVTGPSTSEYIFGIFNALDSIDIACGRYSSAASCDQNAPHISKAIIELTVPESKIKPQSHSPLIPLMTIMDRLDSGF